MIWLLVTAHFHQLVRVSLSEFECLRTWFAFDGRVGGRSMMATLADRMLGGAGLGSSVTTAPRWTFTTI